MLAARLMKRLGGPLLGLALSGAAQAHGGLAIDSDMCKLRLGPFNMHFTGYQPEINGNREFCEDIPKLGHTIVVMDAIEPELREMPIEVRIIRDTGDESRLDAVTVVHLPPKTYMSGSVPFEYSFTTPGKFVGLVTAGDQGQYVSRFPFSVGIPPQHYGHYLLFLGVAVLALGLYRYSGTKRRRLMAGRA
ncbi:hypothetical protein [Nevskia sp.]|uniref:hypothetical protein n=1 Tax=Nevskia sp. TaxID=1929292 RepID=UPI0025EDBB5E|nr:hypothetical protein [Nevskia sp.]